MMINKVKDRVSVLNSAYAGGYSFERSDSGLDPPSNQPIRRTLKIQFIIIIEFYGSLHLSHPIGQQWAAIVRCPRNNPGLKVLLTDPGWQSAGVGFELTTSEFHALCPNH